MPPDALQDMFARQGKSPEIGIVDRYSCQALAAKTFIFAVNQSAMNLHELIDNDTENESSYYF